MVVGTAVGAGGVAGFALSQMVQVIKALYNMGSSLNDSVDAHIDALKRSDNQTVASTGNVIDAAKFGFGLGYISPIVIIAVGQHLLGNSLAAVGTVASGLVMANPVAMTCAAVGAIYYGWNALSDKEKDGILARLQLGLEVGVELIRSIVEFVIRTTRELFTSKQLEEFKQYVKAQAALFGKSLFDVTHKVADLVVGAAEKVGELAADAVDATRDLAKGAYGAASEAVSDAASAGKGAADRIGTSITDTFESGVSKTKQALKRGSEVRPPSEDPPSPPANG